MSINNGVLAVYSYDLCTTCIIHCDEVLGAALLHTEISFPFCDNQDQTLDELPVPLGARLMSRFLEAASKEAGKTLRVTAYTDSFNLGACQAFNQLGLYPIEASFGELMGGQERGVNYKWISTVPYTHPNGFIEKLVEKERRSPKDAQSHEKRCQCVLTRRS